MGLKLTNLATFNRDLPIFCPCSAVHKQFVGSLQLHGWAEDQPEHLCFAHTSCEIASPNPLWFHSETHLARNLNTLFMFMLCPTCLTNHPERDPARTSLPHTSTNNYKKSNISLAHFTPGPSKSNIYSKFQTSLKKQTSFSWKSPAQNRVICEP